MKEEWKMNSRLPKREEVPVEMTWRLEDIFPDEGLWEQELHEAGEIAAQIREFEGRLGESAHNLCAAMKLYDECTLKLDRIGEYAFIYFFKFLIRKDGSLSAF